MGRGWLLGCPQGEGLGFSVMVFSLCAVCAIALILVRRFCLRPAAELGGPRPVAWLSATLLIFLWLLYIMCSTLKAYEVELGIAPFGEL